MEKQQSKLVPTRNHFIIEVDKFTTENNEDELTGINDDTPVMTVYAVGPECKEIKEKDRVIIHGGSMPVRTVVDSKTFAIFRETDVIAILK